MLSKLSASKEKEEAGPSIFNALITFHYDNQNVVATGKMSRMFPATGKENLGHLKS